MSTLTVDRDLIEWPPMLDRVRSTLERYSAVAADLGVAIALETDGNNSERLLEFICETDPLRCGICFDTGHAQINRDAVYLARLLGSRVICTHLHDNRCPSEQRHPRTMPELRAAFERYCREDIHLLPFSGVVDWGGVLEALYRAGYRGMLTYETGRPELLPPINARLAALWTRVASPQASAGSLAGGDTPEGRLERRRS